LVVFSYFVNITAASAQALRTHLEKLEDAQVKEIAANAFNEFIFSPLTTGIITAAFVLAIFFYAAKNRRISFFLALTGILLVLCRYLTTLIKSPIDFAFYVVFPLFITAIALRIHYKL